MATLKKLMTLMSKEGMADNRADIISTFTHGRTTSAKNLNPSEIDSFCEFFEKISTENLDKKRKRVIAAIFGLYKKMNKDVSLEYVKSHACRAAKVDDFNKFPSSRLDVLFIVFLKPQKIFNFSINLFKGYKI